MTLQISSISFFTLFFLSLSLRHPLLNHISPLINLFFLLREKEGVRETVKEETGEWGNGEGVCLAIICNQMPQFNMYLHHSVLSSGYVSTTVCIY